MHLSIGLMVFSLFSGQAFAQPIDAPGEPVTIPGTEISGWGQVAEVSGHFGLPASREGQGARCADSARRRDRRPWRSLRKGVARSGHRHARNNDVPAGRSTTSRDQGNDAACGGGAQVARSADGFTNWEIDPQPTLEADQSSREEKWGLEDPRIIWLEEQKQFAITYVSFSEGGPVVSLAITKNFRTFARLGALLPPEDKDACLLPRRFRGRFALIHRPIVRGEAHIWISFSPDLKHWGDHRLLIKTRSAYWDCHRVGLACQPIETPQGWMLFYHGVRVTSAGQIYRLGMALLDLEEPWKVLRRGDEWVLGPREPYERIGDVGDVVFPTRGCHSQRNQSARPLLWCR